MSVKQAVVMVGGKGTRLLPLTNTRPKLILPVVDRPCLWYLLRALSQSGIREVILACGYKADSIREAMGDGSDSGLDISIDYSVESEPLGSGGAIKLVEDRLDPTFVAANGDVFMTSIVSDQIAFHQNIGADVTVSTTVVDNPCEYGTIITSEDGRVEYFMEKPRPEEVRSNKINSGVYVINRDVVRSIPAGFYDFSKDLLPDLVSTGRKVYTHPIDGMFIDAGRPSDLMRVNLEIADDEYYGRDWKAPGCAIEGAFYLGRGSTVNGCRFTDTVIMRDSKVVGSDLDRVMLMEGCTVNGAKLRNVILGEGCTVGKGAKVSNAVLADGTVVKPGEVLDEGRDV